MRVGSDSPQVNGLIMPVAVIRRGLFGTDATLGVYANGLFVIITTGGERRAFSPRGSNSKNHNTHRRHNGMYAIAIVDR